MAVEWVAPIGTAVVGLAGIAATYYTGKRQSHTQLQAQREERHQRRIEAGYQELLRTLRRGNTILKLMEFDLYAPDPKGLTRVTQGNMREFCSLLLNEGEFSSVWSPAVAVETETYWHCILRAFGMVISTRAEDINPEDFSLTIQEARALEKKISAQVWRELRGEDAGYLDSE